MSQARFIVGDVRDVLATIGDGTVDLIVTSPPFLALRSYLPADHPDKHREIGSEPTPAEFLRTMLDLTGELRRVLAPHGSLCVELGDTFAGSGGRGEASLSGTAFPWREAGWSSEATREGTTSRLATGPGWPLPKSLCGLPTLYAWSLAYGRNLLAPDQTFDPWRIRNVLVWARPNPAPGALGDKFRPATSYITVACTSDRRWFDLDAVRTGYSDNSHARTAKGAGRQQRSAKTAPDGNRDSLADLNNDGAGAPPLDWHSDCEPGTHDGDRLWVMPTHPYPGAHYATFNPELPARLVKAMCPMQVCRECGEPRRRIAGAPSYVNDDGAERAELDERWRHGRVGLKGDALGKAGHLTRQTETLGWSDCGHGQQWRRGLVLDPFAGSGSTLVAATGAGRDAIGIDIDHRNLDLARERVGMFLEAEVVL